MSAGPVTTPTIATLSASRAQQEAVVRWLRPLGPLVTLVVIGAAFNAHPRPSLAGHGLAVSIALTGFVLGGLGVLATSRDLGLLHIASVVTLLATSGALVWLQPDGAGVAGVFVGASLLATLLRGHRSIPLTVAALVLMGLVVATARHASVTSALLNAIMVGAFYGLMFLAVRLGDANRLAERLLIELEESRAAQLRAASLAERQRLAREMHDVLAHSLSGLLLQLEGARMLAADNASDPRLHQAINRAHQLGRTGLDEARRAIGMLRDDELPGPERLAGLAAQFEQDRRIPCRLTIAGTARELGSETRLALYRVAQEALTNITKHADPQWVELHLVYGPCHTRLSVENFAQTAASFLPAPNGDSDSGYGLTGMRERAELLGGRLTTATTPSGFRVELEVPT